MSSILIIAGVIIFFLLGYKFYGGLIERELVEPRSENPTPAVSMKDGVDFVPSRNTVLFGHHFSSIAGAGPIIGPIVAIGSFGWLATLGWIALGSLFFGAVHDYLSLMVSVRNRGASIADVAEKTMGETSKTIFSIFLWAALVVVVAVFGVVGAKTLVAKPVMVIPTFSLILIAMLFGYAMARQLVPLWVGTVLAVGADLICLYIGYFYPIILDAEILGLSPLMFWFVLLLIYAGVASVLPVHILLQPRDYVATYKLYLAMILGISAIFVVHPPLNAPAFISINSSQGPIWPMLFILVACGAISGFHSLVAGGTSSKQLANEKDGRFIGYGAMLTEGVLAVMTLVLVGAGLYWSKPLGIDVDMAQLGFHETLKGGWIVTFGSGFGNLVHQLFPFISFSLAMLFAMITLNTFVLTTLDTATRVTRFMVQESLGAKMRLLSNKYIALLFVLVPAGWLGITNSWTKIWPIFGATNQLVAALALFIVSTYLIGIKKPTKYTAYPALFMIATTVAALGWQAYHFFTEKEPKFLLGGLSIVLIVLALFVTTEGCQVIFGKGSK
jgi:carbon starvation protein